MVESLRLKKVDLPNGETYAYREAGKGDKVLLLLHGTMTSSLFFDTLIPLLEGFFRVIAVDMRGFGHSTYNNKCTKLDDWAEDINLFLTELKIEKASILGWSTGGGIALKLASKYPEKTDKLILLSSVGPKGVRIPWEGDSKPTLKDLEENWSMGKMLEKAQREGDIKAIRATFKAGVYNSGRYPDPERFNVYAREACLQRNSIHVVYSLMTFNISEENNGIVDGTGEAKKIKNKILILHGEDDLIIKKARAEEYAKLFGSQAILKIFPGGDHSLMTFDLEGTAKCILEFMSVLNSMISPKL